MGGLQSQHCLFHVGPFSFSPEMSLFSSNRLFHGVDLNSEMPGPGDILGLVIKLVPACVGAQFIWT
jgi:hypothetical protein